MKQIRLFLFVLISLLTVYGCDLIESGDNKKTDIIIKEDTQDEPIVVETSVTIISAYLGELTHWVENKDPNGSTITLTVTDDILNVQYDTTTSSTEYPYAQAQVVPADSSDAKVPFTEVKTITIEYKSNSGLKMALNDEGNDGKDYAHSFVASDDYVEVTVNLNTTDFVQPDWATGSRDLGLDNVIGLVFSGDNGSGEYSIKSISAQ